MTERVLDLLELPSGPDHEDVPSVWVDWIERSLTVEPQTWVEAVQDGSGLSDEQAWRLLNFPDFAASLVVREERPELVERACLALALLEASSLDRRDKMVVADLLPRACEITGLDFKALARSGCEPAGHLGRQCLEWLLRRTPRTPPAFYEEVGEGYEFRFRRRPSDFDEDALLARLNRGRRQR